MREVCEPMGRGEGAAHVSVCGWVSAPAISSICGCTHGRLLSAVSCANPRSARMNGRCCSVSCVTAEAMPCVEASLQAEPSFLRPCGIPECEHGW